MDSLQLHWQGERQFIISVMSSLTGIRILKISESKITDKTKAIVIINPNNPTGAVYPKEILEQIVQVAREHQLIIFSDEIYDRLVMDGYEHASIASLAPDVFCVTFTGLSKSHMIAGFRIGWMILSGS